MGLGFNWFKNYEIKCCGEPCEYNFRDYFLYGGYYIALVGGDSTSHSYGNVSKVKDLFEKVSGMSFNRLPYEECIDSKEYKLELINPKEMYRICCKILSGNDVDSIGMRDRFEWFKELSEAGYYIAYDSE